MSASPNVAQARVPAPRLLILGLRFTFLLALEVWPGEGLHGGQETNLGHSPCEPQRFAIVLIHDSQLLSPLHATFDENSDEKLLDCVNEDELEGRERLLTRAQLTLDCAL